MRDSELKVSFGGIITLVEPEVESIFTLKDFPEVSWKKSSSRPIVISFARIVFFGKHICSYIWRDDIKMDISPLRMYHRPPSVTKADKVSLQKLKSASSYFAIGSSTTDSSMQWSFICFIVALSFSIVYSERAIGYLISVLVT